MARLRRWQWEQPGGGRARRRCLRLYLRPCLPDLALPHRKGTHTHDAGAARSWSTGAAVSDDPVPLPRRRSRWFSGPAVQLSSGAGGASRPKCLRIRLLANFRRRLGSTHSLLVTLDSPLPAEQASRDGAHSLLARSSTSGKIGVGGPGVHDHEKCVITTTCRIAQEQPTRSGGRRVPAAAEWIVPGGQGYARPS